MIAVLKVINEIMQQLGIHYEYMEWTSDIVYPYFVGEYVETPIETEDGLKESTFILTGFTRGTWIELEQIKEKIENLFHNGYEAIIDNKSGVAVFYGDSQPIRQENESLKKIQINLEIKEWKVN